MMLDPGPGSLCPRHLAVATVLGSLCFAAVECEAVQVQEIVRIKGEERNKLVGMGLVVGLSGTGDGSKYTPTIRTLAALTGRFLDEGVHPEDVKNSKNVAVVAIEATLPGVGVDEGDHVDVYVSALGSASSLKGGRLFLTPMTGPLPNSDVYAFASGPLTVEDEETPTVAVVKQGGQLAQTISSRFMDEMGRITLVLKNSAASWTVASNLEALINGIMVPDGPDIAEAVDPKNVVINVPLEQRRRPAAFISQIMQSYIDQSQINTGARVLVNEKTGQIIVGAEVEISPVIISTRGLTIRTVTPEPEPTFNNPNITDRHFLAIDPANRGGARLGALMKAFEQLRVPIEDRVAIVKDLDKIGALHGKLIIE